MTDQLADNLAFRRIGQVEIDNRGDKLAGIVPHQGDRLGHGRNPAHLGTGFGGQLVFKHPPEKAGIFNDENFFILPPSFLSDKATPF